MLTIQYKWIILVLLLILIINDFAENLLLFI